MVEKAAPPMTTIAIVSRRKRGWPCLMAMKRRKPGTVRKSVDFEGKTSAMKLKRRKGDGRDVHHHFGIV